MLNFGAHRFFAVRPCDGRVLEGPPPGVKGTPPRDNGLPRDRCLSRRAIRFRYWEGGFYMGEEAINTIRRCPRPQPAGVPPARPDTRPAEPPLVPAVRI